MSDSELEGAIDEVGRDRVFDRARAYGWVTHTTPPKWVWWGIVAELRAEGSVTERLPGSEKTL